ncbi:hypothetical protein SAMN04487905_110184 [Actinopolyspora xinjiangensis]|uniref:Uncharacterized protein n=1 Tax=Actinopolyspora xinjiangensis TaxID=405564 RepID=A0A1H0W3Q3_9ACTN|nr:MULTISPECIES: hypothetical protein [Actinopolyspora]SDP85135.1 hypothetical protein SAMN04487905_110184 [Actinopolyspora xinjiangensis]
MNVRVYTLSAIAVTASAVAGLWFGAIMANADVFRSERPAAESNHSVISNTTTPRP